MEVIAADGVLEDPDAALLGVPGDEDLDHGADVFGLEEVGAEDAAVGDVDGDVLDEVAGLRGHEALLRVSARLTEPQERYLKEVAMSTDSIDEYKEPVDAVECVPRSMT